MHALLDETPNRDNKVNEKSRHAISRGIYTKYVCTYSYPLFYIEQWFDSVLTLDNSSF